MVREDSVGKIFSVTGKVAIVTGGASGLGQRMASVLTGNGASVAIADVNVEGAQALAQSLATAGGTAIAVRLDATDPQSVEHAASAVVAQFGRLDIGVNAAGVAGGRSGDENPITIWRRVIDVDLSGVYFCCLAYSKLMKRQRSGTIINIASMSASVVNRFPQPPVTAARMMGLPAYCAAKAGVKQLTKVLAAEWARDGIRVNCISPGYMATEMTREIFEMPEVVEQIQSDTPVRRVGQPDDLDGVLLYLSSSASAFMTGADVLVDGGYTVW